MDMRLLADVKVAWVWGQSSRSNLGPDVLGKVHTTHANGICCWKFTQSGALCGFLRNSALSLAKEEGGERGLYLLLHQQIPMVIFLRQSEHRNQRHFVPLTEICKKVKCEVILNISARNSITWTYTVKTCDYDYHTSNLTKIIWHLLLFQPEVTKMVSNSAVLGGFWIFKYTSWDRKIAEDFHIHHSPYVYI